MNTTVQQYLTTHLNTVTVRTNKAGNTTLYDRSTGYEYTISKSGWIRRTSAENRRKPKWRQWMPQLLNPSEVHYRYPERLLTRVYIRITDEQKALEYTIKKIIADQHRFNMKLTVRLFELGLKNDK